MPRDKEGNKLTWKEYFSRWKAGIDGITPKQRLENESRATIITLIGFILGIVILIWKNTTLGWLSYALILIFIGNAWSTGMKVISQRIQLKFFRTLESQMDENMKGGKE